MGHIYIADAREHAAAHLAASVGSRASAVTDINATAAKVDGINRRLDVSNGRIAEHEHAIQELRLRTSQMGLQLGHVQEEYAARREDRRRFRMAMLERLLWLLGAVALAAIVRYTGL